MPILDRGGFFARQTPQRSYAAALRRGWVPDAMYLSADSPSRSIRRAPGPDGPLLLVGGHGHVTGRVASEQAQLDALLAWARSELGGTEVTHTWSAHYPGPVNELPYVGPLLPGDDRLLVATGFDKWGFTNAPAAAGILTSRVLGRPRTDEAMSSWSPWEATGVPQALLANGAVGTGWRRGGCGPTSATTARARPRRAPGRWSGARGARWRPARSAAPRTRSRPVCSHLYGVVSWNDAEQSWDCPAARVAVRPDGAVLEGPATEPLAPR